MMMISEGSLKTLVMKIKIQLSLPNPKVV